MIADTRDNLIAFPFGTPLSSRNTSLIAVLLDPQLSLGSTLFVC